VSLDTDANENSSPVPNALYDLSPTDSLQGLHMQGTVARRFLISYGVSPLLIASSVPTGAELSICHGLAWGSACFVHIDDMRPSFAPSWAGTGFNYLIHRTRARMPFPDGKLRESVLVLEANINRPVLGWLAGKSIGVNFRVRNITLTEDNDSWTLRMTHKKEILFEADIHKTAVGEAISPTSKFASASEADQFLLGVSYGGEWDRAGNQTRLFAETHDPWQTLVAQCSTKRNAYLESLGATGVEADHVITMTGIPHYFALGSVVVPCHQAA
jgi:uncharacterized protein YqjF (DUF2071 family)